MNTKPYTNIKFLLAVVILFVIIPIAKANVHQNIAEEHNIKSAPLTYGYPLGFENDSNAVFIYLSTKIKKITKINSKTYITQATTEHAQTVPVRAHANYYLTVDSNVTVKGFHDFIKGLSQNIMLSNINIMDSENKYIPLATKDWEQYTSDVGTWGGLGARNYCTILMNARNEILFESKRIHLDSIFSNTLPFYWANFDSKNDFNYPNFDIIERKTIEVKIKQLKESLFYAQNSAARKTDPYLQSELNKWTRTLYLMQKFIPNDTLKVMTTYGIRIEHGGTGGRLSALYKVYNQAQQALMVSRNEMAMRLFRTTYMQLVLNERKEELEVLALIHPDGIQCVLGYDNVMAPPLDIKIIPFSEIELFEDTLVE